ncbi:MAG: hypothetical protein KJO50_08735 [Bacteroidia bacterium]|nr:hypothetical protein [Bacteroidia bacterium]
MKVCILLILIIKSSMGLGMSMEPGSEGCCPDTNEITIISDFNDMESDQDEEKGCCDTTCECMCCAHIFIGEAIKSPFLQAPVLHLESNSSYTNNYHYLLANLIWQPPRII